MKRDQDRLWMVLKTHYIRFWMQAILVVRSETVLHWRSECLILLGLENPSKDGLLIERLLTIKLKSIMKN
jgi:hypothetical protein